MSMQLRVLAVGKLKNPGLEQLEQDFMKRMRNTFPLEVVTVKDTKALLDKAQRPWVVLDERGTQVSSTDLADWVEDWRGRGTKRVDFLIGDAHGFEDEHRVDADRVLALSNLTLPHRMARMLLVEQLYRVSTILTGHPYHHA